MNLYELLGQKEEQLAAEREAFGKLFAILKALKSGEMTLDRLTVTDTEVKIGPAA